MNNNTITLQDQSDALKEDYLRMTHRELMDKLLDKEMELLQVYNDLARTQNDLISAQGKLMDQLGILIRLSGEKNNFIKIIERERMMNTKLSAQVAELKKQMDKAGVHRVVNINDFFN